MASAIVLSSVRFTPAPTSSRNTIRASTIIVRPSSRSFFCPPERLPARSSARCEMVRKSSTSSARRASARSSARMARRAVQAAQRDSPRCPPGTIIRFSRTVIERNSCAIWNVRRRPFAKSSWGGRPVTSSPAISTRPAVGRSTPATTLKRVVLPAPFGPMSPVIEPSAIDSEAPSTARNPPKRLWRSRTSIIDSPSAGALAAPSSVSDGPGMCRRGRPRSSAPPRQR